MVKKNSIEFRVSEDEKQAFFIACKRNNTKPSEVLRDYVNFIINNPQIIPHRKEIFNLDGEREKIKTDNKRRSISTNEMEKVLYQDMGIGSGATIDKNLLIRKFSVYANSMKTLKDTVDLFIMQQIQKGNFDYDFNNPKRFFISKNPYKNEQINNNDMWS